MKTWLHNFNCLKLQKKLRFEVQEKTCCLRIISIKTMEIALFSFLTFTLTICLDIFPFLFTLFHLFTLSENPLHLKTQFQRKGANQINYSSSHMKHTKVAEWIDRGPTPEIVFGSMKLKPLQKAILNCLHQNDIVANLPTGFGKSLLFQYPASLFKKDRECALVVVPLKALVWDVIREAQLLDVVVQELDNSVMNRYYENDQLPQLIITTPEKIFYSSSTLCFLESLQAQNAVKLLVIDECHCICEWGHDFRPAYLQLTNIRQIFTGVRLLAMSATIPPELKGDLENRLSLRNSCFFMASCHRPNLYYGILEMENKKSACQSVSNFLTEKGLRNDSGIIYCQSINMSEQLCRELKLEGLCAEFFHSKVSQFRRKEVYDGFMKGTIKTIVGTICFGMGINKKDIRYVVHYGVSKSPQNYYQESGRAGRDGEQSYCYILSFPKMNQSLSYLIAMGKNKQRRKNHQAYKLDQMMQYSKQKAECRRRFLFKTLGEDFNVTLCKQGCDLCSQGDKKLQNYVIRDFTVQVRKMVESFSKRSYPPFTVNQLIGLLKGKSGVFSSRKFKKFHVTQFDAYGMMKHLKESVIEQILDKMIIEKRFVKKTQFGKYGSVTYLKIAPKLCSSKIQKFELKIFESVKDDKKRSKSAIDGFNKYLQKKKGILEIEIPAVKKNIETIQKKQEQENEELVEAGAIKEEINYELFFSDLYGSQFNEIRKEELYEEEGGEGEQYRYGQEESGDQKIQLPDQEEFQNETNFKSLQNERASLIKEQKDEQINEEARKKFMAMIKVNNAKKAIKTNNFDFL